MNINVQAGYVYRITNKNDLKFLALGVAKKYGSDEDIHLVRLNGKHTVPRRTIKSIRLAFTKTQWTNVVRRFAAADVKSHK